MGSSLFSCHYWAEECLIPVCWATRGLDCGLDRAAVGYHQMTGLLKALVYASSICFWLSLHFYCSRPLSLFHLVFCSLITMSSNLIPYSNLLFSYLHSYHSSHLFISFTPILLSFLPSSQFCPYSPTFHLC